MGIAYGVTTNFQATKASLQDDILINIDGAASEVVGTTIYDLSGQNTNGTLTNNPTFNKGFGGYFSFDGTDDRIETSYTTALGTGDYTYEAWIRYTEGWAKLNLLRETRLQTKIMKSHQANIESGLKDLTNAFSIIGRRVAWFTFFYTVLEIVKL